MELLFLALLIALMAFALGSGYPVAFALPGAAIITILLAAGVGWLATGSPDAYFHNGGPSNWLSAGVTNLRGIYWEADRDTLIAIPLFIFMGIMLQRSRIAEDLLITMAQLFGAVPGGLGISVVFVGALLAATTGIVGATVVAMGLISLPTMLRNNYSTSLATGTIAASGTLGQIIPPSIVLIILADQLASAADQASSLRGELYKESTGELMMPSVLDVTSTSAGEMFLGAFVPGLLLVGLYMVYILVVALLRPRLAPPVPYDGRFDARFWGKVALTLIPPLTLIFLVLGSIIGGVATVNQAGAIGAAGALIMAGYRLHDGPRAFWPAIMALVALGAIAYALSNHEMNIKSIDTPADRTGITIGLVAAALLLIALVWSAIRTYRIDRTLQGVMVETAKTTSLVFIILLGAAMLTAAFRAFGGEELVRDFLTGLPGGFWVQFIIVMAVIFLLGFFLDFIEIAVVVVPIVAPILLADPSANITAVWLGVMIGLNIQTSFLTPPFGFALFYLRGVAPAVVRTVQMYRGVIPFILLQLIALGVVGYTPPLVNYLPNRVNFLAETAPPPTNPRFQKCLESYVAERLEGNAAVPQAIDTAQTLDLSMLPEDQRETLTEAFAAAEQALSDLDRIAEAEAAVQRAAVEYRPLLMQVRALQRDIRNEREEIENLQTRRSYLPDGSQEAAARIATRIAELEAAIEQQRTQIPDSWPETRDAFAELTDAESAARTSYRRNADTAYQDVAELRFELMDTPALLALEADLRALGDPLAAGDVAAALAEAERLTSAFRDVEGASGIASSLSSMRRDLDDDEPDLEDAREEYAEAIEEYEAQIAWKPQAQEALVEPLGAYLSAIEGTLGVRSQPDLTREQALYLAACRADHTDIMLNF